MKGFRKFDSRRHGARITRHTRAREGKRRKSRVGVIDEEVGNSQGTVMKVEHGRYSRSNKPFTLRLTHGRMVWKTRVDSSSLGVSNVQLVVVIPE